MAKQLIAHMSDLDMGAVVTIELLDEGKVATKKILFEDFRALLDGCSSASQLLVPLGRMPHGIYSCQVSAKGEGSFECAIVIPAGKRMITYEKTAYEVPYPPMMFMFHVEDERLTKSSAYLLDTDFPTDNSKLYQYVFGNVGDGGHICWGSNKLPQLKRLEDVDQLVALFFGSPCNDDYYKYSRFSEGAPEWCKTQRALYEHLKELDEFPLEIIASDGTTIGDLGNKN